MYRTVQCRFLGLIYKAGVVDDALFMLKEAIAIDEKQPESNFMIANMLNVKVFIPENILTFQ